MDGRISPFRPSIITILAAAMAIGVVMVLGSFASAADAPAPSKNSPPAPQNLKVTAISPTSLTLSWDPVPGATKYRTYLDWPKVGETAATTWTFTGLTCATSHAFQVDALFHGSASAKSSITATTSACSASAPSVSGFTPTSGPGGTSVTVNGSSFTGATSVTFNGTAASYTVSNDSQIVATVPNNASTGLITVFGPGGVGKSSGPFTVTTAAKAPSISSFTPTSGSAATSVTVTGSGFTGATAVKFNGASAAFSVASDTQISATVPNGATTGPIAVTGPGGTGTSASSFTVTTKPSISSFTPTSGSAATSVTVTGSGFTGATAVKFNGASAAFSVASDTQISATVPNGATTGPIAVTGPGGTGTSASSFTVTTAGSTLYLSPSGSDKNSCTSSAPCLSFSRAYQVASPGAVVNVTCGGSSSCSYAAQTIPSNVAKSGTFTCRASETFPDGQSTPNDSSGCVTFLPGAGSAPTLASLAVEVPYVKVAGLALSGSVFAGANLARVNQPCSAWNVHDVVLQNLTATAFTFDSASYLYVEGGSYGPLLDQASHVSGCKDSGGKYTQGSHLAIDAVTMHDYRQTKSSTHMECIHFQAGDNSLIANSRFLNCAQQDVSVQTNLGLSSINGLMIENNVFDAACSHPQSGDVCGVVSGGTTTFICNGTGETLANVVMRFNSLNGSPSYQPQASCSMGSFTVMGNILTGPPSSYACSNLQKAGVTYSYNAYTNTSGVTCGTGNVLGVTAASTWVDPSNYSYQLTSTTQAINLTPLSQPHPNKDIVGFSRPQQLTPDAGAYEYH